MTHKDRNHVQVPRNLPPWLDGPKVRAEAKRLDITQVETREIMRQRRKTIRRIDKMLYE